MAKFHLSGKNWLLIYKYRKKNTKIPSKSEEIETELETFSMKRTILLGLFTFQLSMYANEQHGGNHDVSFRQSARCPGMSCSRSRGNFGPIKAPRNSAVKPRGLCYTIDSEFLFFFFSFWQIDSDATN